MCPNMVVFGHSVTNMYENKQNTLRTCFIIRTVFSDGILIMSRVFAYCRVSTTDQTTKNQSLEIKAAGFTIQPKRLIEESISGSVAAKERPAFIKLLDVATCI